MKNLIILSFVLILSSNLFSQVWIDTGAKWTFDYWNVGEWGTYTFEYENDTVIQEKQCEKIRVSKYKYWDDQYGNLNGEIIDFGCRYTYSSGDSVFHFYDGTFYLLYDFSASVGDSWIVAINDDYSCDDDTAVVQVTQTGTVSINDQLLRTITLETTSNSILSINGTCTEKFGNEPNNFEDNNLGPFPGFQYCPTTIIEYDLLIFRCYVDDNFETYNPTQVDCDYLTAQSEPEISYFNLYPNPSNGQFAIELKSRSNKPVQMRIFNAFGSEVYRESNMSVNGSMSLTMNLKDIPEGIYYLNLQGDGANIIKKFVIQ